MAANAICATCDMPVMDGHAYCPRHLPLRDLPVLEWAALHEKHGDNLSYLNEDELDAYRRRDIPLLVLGRVAFNRGQEACYLVLIDRVPCAVTGCSRLALIGETTCAFHTPEDVRRQNRRANVVDAPAVPNLSGRAR